MLPSGFEATDNRTAPLSAAVVDLVFGNGRRGCNVVDGASSATTATTATRATAAPGWQQRINTWLSSMSETEQQQHQTDSDLYTTDAAEPASLFDLVQQMSTDEHLYDEHVVSTDTQPQPASQGMFAADGSGAVFEWATDSPPPHSEHFDRDLGSLSRVCRHNCRRRPRNRCHQRQTIIFFSA